MNVMDVLSQQWAAQSLWELVAVVLAIAYVWLAAKQNILCWPSAFISTGIYTGLFWEYNLPMQSLLNFYYLLMAMYGWWHWHIVEEERSQKVTQRPIGFHIGAILLCCLGSIVLVAILKGSFNQQYLYLDAVIMVFSLFTTWLVTQKVLENWLYWIVINGLAAYLYWMTELYLTSVLMIGYFGFAIYGYLQWQRDREWAPSS